MKTPDADPKKLLSSLLSQPAAATEWPAQDVERASALARAPESASPGDVESLPLPLAEAILEAAVQRRAVPLADALSRSASKPLAKAAKKALYRLKSAGEAVPEPPAPKAAAAAEKPEPESTPDFPALLSSVSGMGERGLIFFRPMRGGLEGYQLLLQDEQGVVHLAKDQTTRNAIRRQLREIRAGRTAPVLEVGRERVAEELAVAVGLNQRSKTPFPAGLDELLAYLGVTPKEDVPPLPLPEEGDAALTMEGHTLHREPEIQAWLPPEKELRLLTERMQQAVHSALELTEQQKGERILELFRKSAEDFFTPPVKKLYARRLWAMAEMFEKTGREQPAKVARAEARRLFHDAPGLASRFGEALFEKVLRLAALTQSGQKLPEPTDEQPKPPPEPRSPGGIILP